MKPFNSQASPLSPCREQPHYPRQTTVPLAVDVMKAEPLNLCLFLQPCKEGTYLLDNEVKLNQATSETVRHPGLCFKAQPTMKSGFSDNYQQYDQGIVELWR